MGTPDFARVSLEALCENGENVIAVLTQSDKPKGRGMTLTPPPVKVYAEAKNIPVYQPSTLRDDAFAALLSELDPDVIIVVAYGKLLPKSVIDYPKFGCINVHGSLLPKYRGAAPIQRAIIEGETVTGITTMYMDVALDTGDMIDKAETAISRGDNFETMHDKLAEIGASLLVKTLKSIKDGTVKREVQDDSLATYAKKIEREDCAVDFADSAESIFNQIRGLSPIPLAYTKTTDGKLLKLAASVVMPDVESTAAGVVLSLDTTAEDGVGVIRISCGDGTSIGITEVVPEGKRRMTAAEFIRGRKINAGDTLSS
jgi:methionyl-tRNA formyltransferase